MSIPSTIGVGRVTNLKSDTPTPTATANTAASSTGKQTAAKQASELQQYTQQASPPRFPWLSRLSLALEAASKQRAAFPAAPVIGDSLDKAA
jgi:hypothetical protein